MNINNFHAPAWLERNGLYRGVMLFRKLFLTKLRVHHYAQFGEDIALARLFRNVRRGFYVDVGCFHPIQHSNTWALYRRGWRGINVDADAIKIAGFDLLRRHDTNVACAVSDADRDTVTFYSHGLYSLRSSLDVEHARKAPGVVGRTVPCSTLTRIIESSPYRGRPIDLLSVDAEGHDLAVLRSLDFATYRPSVIAVETYAKSLPDVQESELYRFLDARHYRLVGWCGLTLLMASRDFLGIKAGSRQAA